MPRLLQDGLVKYKPEEVMELPSFMRNIYRRLHNRDQDFLMVFTGKKGTGKSYAALKLATVVDPNFTVKNNVIFEPLELFKLIDDDERTYPGMAVIWEEVGVAMDAKSWYSMVNKSVSYMVQTMRKKHMCLIMTVPDASFFDSSVRKMLNAYAEMDNEIDRLNNISSAKVFLPQYNFRYGKTIFPYHKQINHKTGRKFIVKKMRFPKVETKLANEYEKKRSDFMGKLGKEIVSSLRAEGKKMERKATKEEMASKIFQKPNNYRNQKGEIDAMKIKMLFGISDSAAYRVSKMAKLMLNEA